MDIPLNKTVRVNGTLTDATTFTVHVIRNDSGADVLAAGTEMTKLSTGKYSKSFTEPVAGLTYTVTYSLVIGGYTREWNETVNGSVEDQVPMPELTGDTTLDTLNSLKVERLRVSRAGPFVSYKVGDQSMNWNQYMTELDRRIDALRKEYLRENPWVEIGIVL